MTDITTLAKRLRSNPVLRSDVLVAADALEAQAKETEKQKHFFALAEKHRDELDARIAELSKAIGLLTTLKPAMEVDANNPVCMAKEIVTHIDARIAELEAENEKLRAAMRPISQWSFEAQDGSPAIKELHDDILRVRAALNGEMG